MSKNVNVNGVGYTGVSKVELNLTGGGTALFQDVDEFDGAALETQVAVCDSSLGGNYGGLKFNHTGSEPALYVATTGMTPSSVAGSLSKDRFPYHFMVRIDTDGTATGTAISNMKASVTIGSALESGVVTVTGNTSIYLINGEVQYTVQKIPM